MIAVDSSALVAIALDEGEAQPFSALIAREGAALGGPTLVETKLVLSRLGSKAVDTLFRKLGEDGVLTIVDFTPDMTEAAVAAFRLYGKGRGHPAGLNYGDCLAYAVARVLNLPLLFKGDDFRHTDIVPAHRT